MHRMLTTLALVLVLTLGAAACGHASSEEAADDSTVLVTAVDYGYEDLPSSVAAGTELTLTNDSDVELHEIVLVRIPADEDRPVSELVTLPPEELFGLVMPNLVGVSLAPPNEDGMVVEGSLVVAEAGRYALLCVIPTGADPDEYMAAAEDPDREGPPQVDGGPPHIVQGMFAELTVDA